MIAGGLLTLDAVRHLVAGSYGWWVGEALVAVGLAVTAHLIRVRRGPD